MKGHSLLKRIRHPELGGARHYVSEHELRASILEHLRLICGTRAGSMITCADFGMVEVSDLMHAFPDATTILARSLRTTIETYEPRLRNVRVRFAQTDEVDLKLRFEITAQIIHEGGKSNVSFETSLNAQRQMEVR